MGQVIEMKSIEGKRFIDVWEELSDIPFDGNDADEMSENFYGCGKGSSVEDVWQYLELVFDGLIIGHVVNNHENWKEKDGDIKGKA